MTSSSSSSPTATSLLKLIPVAGATALGLYCLRSRFLSPSIPDPKLTLSNDAQIDAFLAIYPSLRDEYLAHVKSTYDMPQYAIDRLHRMCDYNILGGKYNRACLVTNTIQIVCQWKKIPISTVWKESLVLGWAIEILQALFLVADDIMDSSITRRGQPCWYRVEDVKMDAVNDTLILESFLFYLLDKYLGNHKHYTSIVKLYQSVSLQTQLGQMLDLLSQPQGRKGPEILKQFNFDLYKRIVCYKTAIYTFYLPLAAGLLVCDVNGEKELSSIRDIAIQLGTKFQIEDDYLDCYGETAMIGKIGTDIRDHKCSWLVVQALLLCNSQQRKTLEEHYGKEEQKSEEVIKLLYRELGLEKLYFEYEDRSYGEIEKGIVEAHKTSGLPTELFMPILKKIHRRQK